MLSAGTSDFRRTCISRTAEKFRRLRFKSTLARSIPDAPLTTSTVNTIVEADFALNQNGTSGWLSGIQYTAVSIDTTLAKVNRNVIGYLGAYHQWDNNWKLTGRFGVQSFGGAQVLNLVDFQPFTQPVIRLDIDRMDDDDNRLFGISAQVSWTPKPAYQLTIRTPLFALKHGRKY